MLWLFADSPFRKDAHYFSDSVGGTSGARTSGGAIPEKWKDEDLGWFPNLKGEYTEFSNRILPKFYLSFWITCLLFTRNAFAAVSWLKALLVDTNFRLLYTSHVC